MADRHTISAPSTHTPADLLIVVVNVVVAVVGFYSAVQFALWTWNP
jgi:hypothetical protein